MFRFGNKELWIVLANYGKGWVPQWIEPGTKREAIKAVKHLDVLGYAQYKAVSVSEARQMGIEESFLHQSSADE